jgi:hypothetical protein
VQGGRWHTPGFLIELINEVGGVGTVCRHRTLRACPVSVPDLPLPVPRSHEEHEALLDAWGINQGHRVWLIKAGQKEEVRVLTECIIDITIPHDLVRTRDNGKPIPNGRGKALAPLNKWCRIK